MKKAQAEMTLEPEAVEEPKDLAAPVNATPAVAVGNGPDDLIKYALSQGASVEVMRGMFELSQQMRAVQAKREFDEAMAEFQSRCPAIVKSKIARDGAKVLYRYAPLDAIVTQVKDLLRELGFSYAITTEASENAIAAICTIKHRGGHSQDSVFKVPTTSGTSIMSGPQKVAAALTFAKRYAFVNALGIMTADEDTDGKTETANPTAPSHDDAALKKQLVEATRKIHGAPAGKPMSDDGKIALTDWLRERKIIGADEMLGTLAGERLKAVVDAAIKAVGK